MVDTSSFLEMPSVKMPGVWGTRVLQSMKQTSRRPSGPACLIRMSGVSSLGSQSRCRGRNSNGAGDSGIRGLPSTLVSPLSVVIIYNIFLGLSSGFVKFYVFDNGKSITSGKTDKRAWPGFSLVLSVVS